LNIARIRENSARWLIETTLNWDKDVRYPAGPPDLAQVLNTLCLLSESYPELLRKIEAEIPLEAEDNFTDRIARILMGMEQNSIIKLADGDIEVSYWVDCFNTSEVIEGLTSYLNSKNSEDERNDLFVSVQTALFRAIRYIECSQADATWGGVADTCGTLFGYLRVTSRAPNVEPEDHIVFQALRWMCDEKQTMEDGSFLHTSYVTVFFLMALIETYKFWELGHKSGAEVYDVALWSSPSQETAERSRRLDLQIKIEDKEVVIKELRERIDLYDKIRLSVAFFIIEFVILMIILNVSGAIKIDIGSMNIDLLDDSLFKMVFGIGFSVILATTPILVALSRMKTGKRSGKI
jgi:hypothetical protein